nr:hypothetical protein [Tanacetum cinerariifolium]
MLKICPNLLGQKFVDPPLEEEILAFIRKLGYSKNIKSLSDVKVETLPQPWRTFRTIINKCLSGKVIRNNLLCLSRAQILWGMYHQKNVDYVYLLWEDLVYQIENQIENKVIPKPKYVRRSTRKKTEQVPKASTGKRIKATTKVAKSGKKKLPAKGLETLSEVALSEAEQMKILTKRSKTQFYSSHATGSGAHEGTSLIPGVLDTESDNDDDDFIHPNMSTFDEEERHEEKLDEEEEDKEKSYEEGEVNEIYNDVNINLEGRDTEMTDALLANVHATQVIEDTYVIMIIFTPEVEHQISFVSSGFISKMLNPNSDTGIDSILNLHIESTSLVNVPVTTNDEIPPSSVTTLPPPPIPLIQLFEDRVKSLEDDFSEFKQTNLFTEAVSSIPGVGDKYLVNQMNEAVKAAKIIMEQVKVDVKEQVFKILPRIKKSVNEQLEAEVLIRSSNKLNTSHAVASNLSELELKKILIDKMENNKSVDRLVQQKTLYKTLVNAYESDKDILATYGNTVTLKIRQDDKDEDDEPSARSNQGSKRRKAKKEPESTSAPKGKTFKSTGSSIEGSKSKTRSTNKSSQAKEQVHTVKDLEEPAHQEFKTGFTEDHPVDETDPVK